MATQNLAIKQYFNQEAVTNKFKELLGSKSTGFVTSVLQVVQNNDSLKDADPKTVFNAAATAAILDLPINNNLGFAYIVPYKGAAQFQMGYKGFIQLAQRSGQVKSIYASEIYDGEILEANPLTGYKFDFSKRCTPQQSPKVIGYAARMELLNGFENVLYMTYQQVEAHAKKFSQTYKKGFGVWKDDFDGMAKKTVIKLLLSKVAPLSVEMQKAIIYDQSVVNDFETGNVTYADNGGELKVSFEDLELLFEMKKEALSKEDVEMAERIIKTKEVKSYINLFKKLQEA